MRWQRRCRGWKWRPWWERREWRLRHRDAIDGHVVDRCVAPVVAAALTLKVEGGSIDLDSVLRLPTVAIITRSRPFGVSRLRLDTESAHARSVHVPLEVDGGDADHTVSAIVAQPEFRAWRGRGARLHVVVVVRCLVRAGLRRAVVGAVAAGRPSAGGSSPAYLVGEGVHGIALSSRPAHASTAREASAEVEGPAYEAGPSKRRQRRCGRRWWCAAVASDIHGGRLAVQLISRGKAGAPRYHKVVAGRE